MEVNLEWYRVFYWTTNLGSLTKAAEKLHITQPAISHTLKQLEQRFGGPLFFRTAKGVNLTAEGEVLYQFVEKAIHLLELGERKMAEMQNLLDGEITIGASDTLCKHYLLPHLEDFHRQYPQIKVRVTNRTTPETISLLKEGKIDFGLVSLPVEDPKIDFRFSSPQQDCLVGNANYVELANSPLPLEQLHQYPLMLLESGSNTRQYIDAFAQGHQIQLQPEFELGSHDLLVQFAVSGIGLTFVVREYVTEELESGKLVEIPLTPAIPTRHVGIATLRGVPLSSAAKHFVSLLPGSIG
ncbi:DNA-binding transcriptional LysR family regulator [Paenibacillus phyllosphaerae]|uniref:DNA-binding transcriptional LysR family regulator n=1 Tax=Paenibacillus phyllosphaerae TaxID=274593 RepID=A0A7W5AWL7_9BACL|nr:LysR family transcriptional regulator [Paenibacillus phyllosphaerae]MBB3110145.1 DNA-binding transcriptional LysR family regulator [Paenibacillus phyllosphaerae]